MRSMEAYPRAAMERAMKVQDVMLQKPDILTCYRHGEVMTFTELNYSIDSRLALETPGLGVVATLGFCHSSASWPR